MKLLDIANPKSEGSTKPETPISSPTMPDLEDADVRFVYYGTSAMEVFFPTETKAKLIQTFPRLNQNTTVLPHVVELAKKNNTWPQANTDQRGKNLKTTTVLNESPT